MEGNKKDEELNKATLWLFEAIKGLDSNVKPAIALAMGAGCLLSFLGHKLIGRAVCSRALNYICKQVPNSKRHSQVIMRNFDKNTERIARVSNCPRELLREFKINEDKTDEQTN